MEIWFTTDKKRVRLPILPSEMIISGNTIQTTIEMLSFGEVNLYGGNKAREGEISCFFPSLKNIDNYSFLQYKNYIDPYSFASIFRKWSDAGQIVQLIVTPSIASFPVRIISFEYGEKDGSGDVYYTLKWKEVRKINIKKLTTLTTDKSSNTKREPNQTQEKENNNTQKTHTVKKGDSLYKIAKQYYGDGALYPKIVEKNKTKYPSLVKNPSYIVDGWALVI